MMMKFSNFVEGLEATLDEKSSSIAQQRAAGLALAAKRGEIPASSLTGAALQMMNMSEKDLEDFARTSHEGLPYKVEQE